MWKRGKDGRTMGRRVCLANRVTGKGTLRWWVAALLDEKKHVAAVFKYGGGKTLFWLILIP
ncbi:MAG: hypothetical protein EAY75_02590 [Bacteroidetes bacterium]|nr:MAG: hypothetical protein EAY75_02590 [Bacteroidota bacterium]